MDAIVRWWTADAEWWEFWMPQSGVTGGAVLGSLGWAILTLAGVY